MRIDPTLCHKILVVVEADPTAGTGQYIRPEIDGYDQATVAHHVKYLWDEELVTGVEVTNQQSTFPEIMVQDITAGGRHYLDEREPEAPRGKIGF